MFIFAPNKYSVALLATDIKTKGNCLYNRRFVMKNRYSGVWQCLRTTFVRNSFRVIILLLISKKL
jgi:hypothetical protein